MVGVKRLMALDFFRIASQGVFPTPTPTGASRMASAVSQGLINFTLPAPPEITGGLVGFIVGKFKNIFLHDDIVVGG